jgi:hypothetical protein
MALDGSYRVKINLMGNSAEGTVVLRTNGSALEGNVTGMGMQAQLQDGKANGDSFSGAIEGPTPLGQMRFKVTGEVDGDRIVGTLRAGLVKAEFAGVRI